MKHGAARVDINQLIEKVSSNDANEVYKSLKELHGYFKKGHFRRTFIDRDGINHLSSQLASLCLGHLTESQKQQSRSSSAEAQDFAQDTGITKTILSCLKRLMNESKVSREQFIKADGLSSLGRLLSQTSDENIVKDVCWLITAIAEDELVTPEVITALVNRYAPFQDTPIAVTILRTLWVACSSEQLIIAAAIATGFQSIVKTLCATNERIGKASLRVLHKLLKDANSIEQVIGIPLLECDGLKLLLDVMQKNWKDSDHCMASDCLHWMISIPQIRVSDSCTDFIEFCAQELSQESGSKRFQNALFSLCLCAMEAMNRNKLRITGALEKLVKILGEAKYSQYHFQIVSTFVCFLFDDPSLDVMLRAGLLANLISYLERILKLQSENQLDQAPKTVLAKHSPMLSPDGAQGPASADGSSPNIHGARGHFHDVMLLLGKLSQTSAIRFMVTKSCITPILVYLSNAEYLDPKAVKILTRITENAHFFELLLKQGMVQSVYYQLNTGYDVDYLETIATQASFTDIKESCMINFSTDTLSFLKLLESFDCKTVEDSAPHTRTTNKHSNAYDDSSIPLIEKSYPYSKKRCAYSLITNISRHAESPFGQGVLTHALLSDCPEIKEAFTFGYCFLCRSPSFTKHIFIDLKGLAMIINVIRTSSNDNAKVSRGFLALSGLAMSTGVRRKKLTIDPACFSVVTPESEDRLCYDCEARADYKRRKVVLKTSSKKCCMFTNIICSRIKEKGNYSCGHVFEKNNEENPTEVASEEDVCFFLEGRIKIMVKKSAIQSASPVFAAMLSDSFVDSSLPFVSLEDVRATSFLVMLHHIFGCRINFECMHCHGCCSFVGTVEVMNASEVKEDKGEVSMLDSIEEELVCKQGDDKKTAGNPKKPTVCSQEDCKDSEQIQNLKKKGQELEKPTLGPQKVCESTQSTESNELPRCFTAVMTVEQKFCLITDVMRISDKFLVDKLHKLCEDHLRKSITPETMVSLYMEALLCQAQMLSVDCVKYFLCDIKDPILYLKAAFSLYRSGERDRFIADVENVLKSQITNKR